MYQQELDAALLVQQVADAAHQGYAVVVKFKLLVQALENFFGSLESPSTLPQKSFGDFLEFMRSKFEREYELRAKENRTPRIPIISAGDEQH